MAEQIPGGTPTPPTPPDPLQGSSTPSPSAQPSGDDAKYAYLLKSPFAMMFKRTGAMPTGAEIHAIINGILKQELTMMQQNEKRMKAAAEKMKKAIEGND